MSDLAKIIAGNFLWIFLIFVSVGGMLFNYLSRRDMQKTLQIAMQRGETLDPALIEKVMGESVQKPGNMRRDLAIGGIVTLFAGIGVGVGGYFISLQAPEALMPMIGAGAIAAVVGLGLFVASRFVAREESGPK